MSAKKTRKTMRLMAVFLGYLAACWIAVKAAEDAGWLALLIIWVIVGEALASHWKLMFDMWWQQWYWKRMGEALNEKSQPGG